MSCRRRILVTCEATGLVRVAGALFAAALLAGCPAAKTVEAQPAAPTSAPASQHAELTQMDGRIVVPMPPRMANHHRQQMRSHLEVVQQIVAALATDDFAQVRKAAEPIAASASNDHQCEMMGRGAEGFTEQALRFHETANGILGAADEKDRAGVLTALSETVAVCTGCHAAFQQEIVTWDDWKARTAK